ncbi:MAG: hypothetical protein V2A34_14360 [Lentisphaerota bacterium]
MTTQDDIVFFCSFCGQKIAIHESRQGCAVDCPSCLRCIPVPTRDKLKQAASASKNGRQGRLQNGSAKRITIPKGASLKGPIPLDPATTDSTLSSSPDREPQQNETPLIALGFVSLLLGMSSSLFLPAAIFVHLLLFLTALVAAMLCIIRRLEGTGAVLLLFTGLMIQLLEIPKISPLLLQFAPKPVIVQKQEMAPMPAAPPETIRLEQPPEPSIVKNEEPSVLPPVPLPSGKPAQAVQEVEAPAEAILPAEKPAELTGEPVVATQSAQPAEGSSSLILPTVKPALPFTVYRDCNVEAPFSLSGFMGYLDALEVDDCWDQNPHSGDTCIRLAFNATYHWGGIALQTPPNNWGDESGGFNLSEARELSFWARAERNGTMAEFKAGLRSTAPFADTSSVTTGKKKLTQQWKQFKLPLREHDLSRVISGFVCVMEGTEIPPIVYLDDIEYQ